MFTCDNCGEKRSDGKPVVTMTGRRICRECNDELLGAAAGVIAGGGVPGAIATAGWFSRLR